MTACPPSPIEPRRARKRRGWFILGLSGALLLTGWFGSGPPARDTLRICDAAALPADPAAKGPPDGLRQLYPDPAGWFYLSSSAPASLFVLATGVQVLTDSGWQTVPSIMDHHGGIWRLKPGEFHEFCVERPRLTGKWRPYLRYGNEMKGLESFYWRLREAWNARSFTNWNGQAWGGGYFSGERILVGDVIEESVP